MADITIPVMIVGSGPAGSAAAALLSSQGIDNLLINRHRWLANTPRAHITNQRCMEVLRDLGPEVEADAYQNATPQALMGENVFCVSLAGEELGRLRSWGTHPRSQAAHLLASPCQMNDLPQTYMEPLLFKTACARGTAARMACEYLDHIQDAEGVTVRCRDRLSGTEFMVRCEYLIGADGGNSLVADRAGLPFAGKRGVGGSINIHFRADLTRFVAHRPSVLYWVMQPGADVGGIGMGLVRMVRPWHEWLIVWGYDIEAPPPTVDAAMATQVARQLVGDPKLEIELLSASTWTVNNQYATCMQDQRVFIMGDAAHRHPPSNGLGSNTSIQDAFNLAWKLAAVLKGHASATLLDSYTAERAPIARQIVTRANQSIAEFGPIFAALGMDGGLDHDKIRQTMDARCAAGEDSARQRAALREAIAFKRYEFDCHGVEMNQRYESCAVLTDPQVGSGDTATSGAPDVDMELHYLPTTRPGARVPHAWVFDHDGHRHSTLDLCGHGRFALITGIGGEAWVEAAKAESAQRNMPIDTRVIGPRRDFEDHTGDWAGLREMDDSGCLLVRPDHHVAWRATTITSTPAADLARALTTLLGKSS